LTDIPLADSGGPVVIALPAVIDQDNASTLGERLASAFGHGVSTVVADMAATVFCDSPGARMLALACLRAADNDAELRLAAAGPAVLRALELAGLGGVVPVYSRVDEALARPQA
jgi:anti-anti-sigma factor